MKLSRASRTALAALMTLTIAGCSGSGGSIPVGTALGPETGPSAPTQGFGMNYAVPGVPMYFALWHPRAYGASVVRFKSIEVVGIPPEFVIDSIVALWGRPGGVFQGWDVGVGQIPGTPINQLVLDPRCPPAAHCGPPVPPPAARVQNWVILVRAHITRPGKYLSKGLRVVYEVDAQQYQQTFPYVTVGADSGPGNSPQSTPTPAP